VGLDQTRAAPVRTSVVLPKAEMPAEALPGEVLAGRYEILAKLGEGGMGAVYKARDRELDRSVAIKMLRPELANQSDIVMRFKNELILARQITHRNVVRIFDISVGGGTKFITMEFVEGEDLQHRIADAGALPLDEALTIFRQALAGLGAAHQEGVVHRDLKPQNIMVDPRGRVFLMDFGIASSAETSGMTRTGALMGTPYYMSPEQARGESADARSDLFSMGVMFFTMLTGVLPYRAASAMDSLIKRTCIKAERVRSINPAIPEYIDAIVAKCLEMRPERRYQTAAEILADLEAKDSPPAVEAGSTGGDLTLFEHSPGTLFGPRYRIDSLLGKGGMGTVYKAWDTELDRPVALKLMHPARAGDRTSFDKLKQEILLASGISHRNILRIHDLGDVDGIKFISMAYIDGTDLAEIIADDGRLPVERAVPFAMQLCEALQSAHDEGVLHRDLKPQNILVNKENQVFISDFGLATRPAVAGTQEIQGTPQYMAPEQVEGKALDSRSDLYALGLILYEMVTGARPFGSDTIMQTMIQRVSQPPRNPKLLNPELPDDLTAVILKCLEKDPARRYQQASELLAALKGLKNTSAKPVLKPYWIWAGFGVAVLLALAAIPQTRHAALAMFAGASGKSGSATAPARYMAVIPMRVAGDDPGLSLIADGLVYSLSARLSQLKDVHLASQAETARVNPHDSLDRIAQSLGAKLILQGEVSGSGDKVQIAMSLNEPATGRRLWSHAFSGLKQDILTTQDEVYQRLVTAMGLKLSSDDMARGAARPTENAAAYGLYLEGRKLLLGQLDEKNLTKALELFQDAANKDPNFAYAYTGLSDASLYMYDLTKDGIWTTRAEGAANHAQQLNDNLPEVHFSLGSLYNTTGKTAEAIAEFQRAQQLAPNSDEAYRRMGRAYHKAGREKEAVVSFEKAIDANPYYWLNHNLLGISWSKLGDTEQAQKAFERVTQLDPGRAIGWSNLGSIDHSLGQWENSVAMYKKAVELQPSAVNYSNLGGGVYFLGRCDEAKTYFEKAVALQPAQVALGNLASAYRCLGQGPAASNYYKQAIDKGLAALQVNPRNAEALAQLGEDYARNGDVTRGVEFTRRAQTLDPQNGQILFQSAVVSALSGNRQQALDLLRQAIAKGYSRKEAAGEPDLKGLSADPEFRKLVQ